MSPVWLRWQKDGVEYSRLVNARLDVLHESKRLIPAVPVELIDAEYDDGLNRRLRRIKKAKERRA